MKKEFNIQSKVTKEEFEVIRNTAEKEGRTISNLVRHVIKRSIGGQ